MSQLTRYHPSPSTRYRDPLDRYIARDQIQRRILWITLLLCIFLSPALLGWGFGAGAGKIAAWMLYQSVIYLLAWAAGLLALLTMAVVAVQFGLFLKKRRY